MNKTNLCVAMATLFLLLLSCTPQDPLTLESDTPTPTTEISLRDDLNTDRFRDCLFLEPIVGQFCYEDGLSTTWVDNANGYTTHTLESGSGKGYVVDANLDRIVFRSTTHRLGRKVLIHNMGGNGQQSPCVKVIKGSIYTLGNASYVKISAADIFDCIWPQQEVFDFNYALCGAKM